MDRSARLDIALAVASIGAWSTAYVAPQAVQPAGELLLVCGRYLLFALCGVIALVRHRAVVRAMPMRRVVFIWHLGLIGYFVFYVAVSFAVSSTGGFVVAILVGSAPIGIALVGNLTERRLAWRAFLPLVLAIAIGIVVIIAGPRRGATGDLHLAGVALALLASGVWVYFVVLNARAQRTWADMPPAIVSAALVAVGAGSGSLLLLPAALTATPLESLDPETLLRLAAWIVWLGVFVSWLGTVGWIRGSRSMSVTVAGPLLACDPIFGALLSLAYDQRLPSPWEIAGSGLIVAGIVGCILLGPAHHGRRPDRAPDAPAAGPTPAAPKWAK